MPVRLISTLLAAWLISLIGCGRTPQAYIDQGNKLYDGGKYDDAGLQFKKAIQKDPKAGEAYYRLALVELKQEKPGQAYQDLQRAVELTPNNVAALSQLGQLAISRYNTAPSKLPQFYQQAAKIAAQLLSKQPDGFDGNLLQGAVDLADKKPGEAVLRLRKALQAKPVDPTAQLGLAHALAEAGDIDAGRDLARQIVQKDKTFGAAYDFLFERYVQAGQLREAENILKQKVAENPDQSTYVVELARFYARQRKMAEVSETLKKLTDDSKRFPDGALSAGDFYASIGELDQAAMQYESGLQTVQKNRNIYRKRLVRILGLRRRWPELYAQIAACLKDQPDDQEAKLMRAVAWLDEGRPENLDSTIAEFRAQLVSRPQDSVVHFQLGNALAKKGNANEARREWSASARAKRDYLLPRYALAQLDLSEGKSQDALRTAQEIIAVTPSDEKARILHVACLTGVGQFDQARAELNKLGADFPQSLQVKYRLGVLALSEKRYGQAESIFRQLASAPGADPRLVSGLAQAYVGENDPAKAMGVLQDEIKRNPSAAGLRVLLGQVAMASGKYDVAVEQYKQIPPSAETQRALARAYRAQGNQSAAIGVLSTAAQSNPTDAGISLELAQGFVVAGRMDDAQREYRRLLKMQPNNGSALNDLAYLLADFGGNLDEALSLARKGAQFAADASLKASVSDTLGWIYLKKQMYDSALQTFQNLVSTNPGNMTFRYHLGMTLYQMGSKARAKTELEAALSARIKSDDEPRIRELLARF